MGRNNANRIDSPEAYDKLTNPTVTTGNMPTRDPAVLAATTSKPKGRNGRAIYIHAQAADIVLTRLDAAGTTVTYVAGELAVGSWFPVMFKRITCAGGTISVAWE